uniref:RNA cap guanine-N2 methyltransferase n=1 Tax=Megaviridae environmental sample TaxID=1737588 RepID=A0A5J6VKM8_9VIRU|nr:MAG: RNA cap guanine-N2 methyltransferase [Megaviridae environmental sample]
MLFPHIDTPEKLMIDKIGKYSITTPKIADDISHFIQSRCDEFHHIIDATAGVGGNIISFAKHFEWVYGIEWDDRRFVYLKNNIEVFNLQNVTLFHGDCLDIIPTVNANILFIDPPWGGRSYKYRTNITLQLGATSLERVCMDAINSNAFKGICLKLPFNYDINYLNAQLNHIPEILIIDKILVAWFKLF